MPHPFLVAFGANGTQSGGLAIALRDGTPRRGALRAIAHGAASPALAPARAGAEIVDAGLADDRCVPGIANRHPRMAGRDTDPSAHHVG